jgi:site-specific DNA-cytosine methylase
MAGFRELLAVEWEQNAADTFRLNFPQDRKSTRLNSSH